MFHVGSGPQTIHLMWDVIPIEIRYSIRRRGCRCRFSRGEPKWQWYRSAPSVSVFGGSNLCSTDFQSAAPLFAGPKLFRNNATCGADGKAVAASGARAQAELFTKLRSSPSQDPLIKNSMYVLRARRSAASLPRLTLCSLTLYSLSHFHTAEAGGTRQMCH